jgi:hypothetical protein
VTFLFRFAAFAVLVLTTHVSPGQTSIKAYRADVVMIEAPDTNDSLQKAAGMYVGHDLSKAYFVTAAHAVKFARDHSATVRLSFYLNASSIEASVFGKSDDDRDLAIIVIPVTNLPGAIRRTASKDPVDGMPIHIIGHPTGNDWQIWDGSVQNEVAVESKAQWFSGSGGTAMEGYSGGPVLDSTGNFLGMHIKGGLGYTVQLKSSAILEQLRIWGVPSDNVTLEDTDTRRFRIARQMIDALRQDDAETVRASFSKQARDSFSNTQLLQTWAIDMAVLGTFISMTSQTRHVVGSSTLYVTAMRYEKGMFEVRLLFDGDDQIINFWLATLSGVPTAQMEKVAKEAVQRLADGDYIGAYNTVPDSFRSFTSSDALHQMWTTWENTAGKFAEIEWSQKVQDFDLVSVRCKFANKDVIVQVQLSPSMQVINYNAIPAP